MNEIRTAWWVYMVRCSDESLYTGITTDLQRRIAEHNGSKKGAKYTSAKRPVQLVYAEHQPDRSQATKREYAIKKMSRMKKLHLVEQSTFSLPVFK